MSKQNNGASTEEIMEFKKFEEDPALNRRVEETVSHRQLYEEMIELKNIARKQDEILSANAEDTKNFRKEITINLKELKSGMAATNAVVMQIMAKV